MLRRSRVIFNTLSIKPKLVILSYYIYLLADISTLDTRTLAYDENQFHLVAGLEINSRSHQTVLHSPWTEVQRNPSLAVVLLRDRVHGFSFNLELRKQTYEQHCDPVLRFPVKVFHRIVIDIANSRLWGGIRVTQTFGYAAPLLSQAQSPGAEEEDAGPEVTVDGYECTSRCSVPPSASVNPLLRSVPTAPQALSH
ncbi:hypothetical protein BDV93DRAFT_515359 [Ceratobasidium sp. AG-I]|nr:hypothetical protein BDV93DRAFT_515359 [Ceratobasidium sp. AG-I]